MFAFLSLVRSVAKSATNIWFQSAGCVTANCIITAMSIVAGRRSL